MTDEETQTKDKKDEGTLPSWLAGFDSSLFSVPVPLAGAEVESRKTMVVDLMSAAAELAAESERLGSEKSAVDKVLKDKQADARRIAHEIHFKVRDEEAECVRVPLLDEGLVALRRPDKRGMPILALYDLGEAEAESTGQIKLNARSRKFTAETAARVAAFSEVERARLHR